ncbi:MAG: DUF1080 domain-containing protein [Ruminococcaceae bacterium]|nr:DUF1080 domain-containing protein [Oscillospiraceae bacterium]
MKRFISMVITLAMLLSLCSFFAISGAAAVIEISNTSPAITADVGETIDLSSYSVVFDGDTSATSDITWKNGASTITSFKPSAKGVTNLTATSGSKTKTIYVVAKEADETEYVLYEEDFSKYSSTSQLESKGWKFLNSADRYSFKDGAFVLGNISDGYARAILPAWLGDFGDYGISTDVKMLTTQDTGRWVGIVYRIQNTNGKYYPYYHMCVREATTASGIEFAERTAGDGWNVVLKASGDITSLKNAYNNFTVNVYGNTISYNINNSQVMFVTEDYFGKSVTNVSAAEYQKGMLGLTMNYGTVAFKNIKVTVQENAPVKAARKLDLINNAREDVNLINPIANVEYCQNMAEFESTEAGSVFIFNNMNDYATMVKNCVERNILATYNIDNLTDAEAFVAAMKSNNCKDANVISYETDVLSYIRKNITTVRTGLIANPEDYDNIHDLRVAVRSAPATFVALDCASDKVTKELVMEIQEYAIAVWCINDAFADNVELDTIRLVTAGVNGIITSDAAKTAELINKHFVENAMTRTPVLIGHRGNPSQAPENTMSSFIAAYENGADVFEVDVEITKDGEIIIMHDNTLNRTTTYTGTKTVNQMTLEEVKAEFILAKANDKSSATTEKVPTLKEVCDYFKDKDCKIFVEFKGSNAQNVPVTMKLLDDYGMDYLVDVISFSASFLTQTQTKSPGMSTGYLLSGQDNGATTEDALASLYPYLTSAQSVNSTINPACGIVRSNGNYFTKAVTDRGITVWPWTYTYSSNHIGFLSGCDGVTTDDMQWATDMAKYLVAPENTTIAVGQPLALGAKVITYGNSEFIADSKSTVASVIVGDDVVSVVDGKLVGLKEGTATVILGYRSTTPTGGVYVTYTQPFEITVSNDKEALKAVVDYATSVNRADYIPAVYEEIKAAIAEAEAVLSDAEATEAEISAASTKLASLINDTVDKTPASVGASYTTTAPNRGDGNANNDDGIRLTDGAKGTPNGATYSGWSSGVKVEIVLDLGKAIETNSYSVYAAAGFWGISKPKSVNVQISVDGETYTDLGDADIISRGTNGKSDGYDVQLWQYLVYTKELNSARYVKFTVTPTGNHTWIDEVEACVSAGEITGMLGDINNDEAINQYDYILVKRHYFETRYLTDDEMTRADVNGDGNVNQYDYILIKRHYFGTYVIG